MTAERRLSKLEGALSPKVATLLWLEEAQRFGSLPAYVDWLIEQPITAAPLERVPEQARAAALEATRGLPREVVRAACHQAVRDAIFLVELVLRLNSGAEETIRIEGLRYNALFWEMRALSAEAEPQRGTDRSRDRRAIARRWAAWRTAVRGWLTDLTATDEARPLLERRYLDGRGVLFPDLALDWQSLRETGARLAALAEELPARRDGSSTGRGRRNLPPRSTAVAAPGGGRGRRARGYCPRSGPRSARRYGGGRCDCRTPPPNCSRALTSKGHPRSQADRVEPDR